MLRLDKKPKKTYKFKWIYKTQKIKCINAIPQKQNAQIQYPKPKTLHDAYATIVATTQDCCKSLKKNTKQLNQGLLLQEENIEQGPIVGTWSSNNNIERSWFTIVEEF